MLRVFLKHIDGVHNAVARLGRISGRIYESYFMPSRMKVYRTLLESAVANSYHMLSVLDFHRLTQAGELDSEKRYFILRHDIDTDLTAAREFWQIERDLGATASHYFRLCTLDLDLMREIDSSGSEASYHYEEIATVAKEDCLRTRNEIMAALPRIRDRFAQNYRWLQKVSGLPLRTVAAHGDFANRKLLVTNVEILKDQDLRSELGIELETYDEAAQHHIQSRHSDDMPPQLWKPRSPFEAIQEGLPVIYVLTHPRHFRCRITQNLSCDLRRLYEGACYGYGIRSRHSVMRQATRGGVR
jgi:hypothetical protein